MGFGKNSPKIRLVSDKTYYASELKTIQYELKHKEQTPILLISHSYGKTILTGKRINNQIHFEVPDFISEKTGTLTLQLSNNQKIINKQAITIISNPNTATQIENYLGPRTILAEPEHFTMMVSVTTDGYDNPKPDGTKVKLSTQYQETITSEYILANNFVAWKKIYSHKKKGKLLVSTYCKHTASKSIETEIQANIATNFQLNYDRNHRYADGNQITTVSTSIIRDKYDNIVNDGTFVNFIIKNKENNLLRSYGSTVNGIATAQLLHPDHSDTFLVSAFVAGISESNTLKIDYDKANTEIPYRINYFHRTIKVGPIKSYMNQIIPDGIQTTAKIYYKGKFIAKIEKYTTDGYVDIIMDATTYPENNYSVEITTLGNTIHIPEIKYEN